MTLGELALIGTGRAGPSAGAGVGGDSAGLATDTPIDDLVSHLAARGGGIDVERQLLLMAGAFDAYRRAGFVPPRIETLPDAAPVDARPACSIAVSEILREMIDGGHFDVLPEAFTALAHANQRLSHALLPSVLDLADTRARTAARAVVGERGRWLARLRDRWSWASALASDAAAGVSIDDLRRTWDEGSMAARLQAVAHVRAIDPAMAREWIAATWSSEALEDRVKLIGIFDTRLSTDDESWLNAALKDRSATVRARVALLLARLPESAFARRAIDRAAALLSWQPSTDGGVWTRVKAMAGIDQPGGTLHVSPPTEADPAWEQDGMSIKPPKGIGERGHWLTQLLEVVPPSHWSRTFAVAPRALLLAAWRSEWSLTVVTGLSGAALLHQDKDWIVALWDSWFAATDRDDPLVEDQRQAMLDELFIDMPAAEAEERLIAFLRDPRADGSIDPLVALLRFEAPVSARLADSVLDAADQLAGANALALLSAAPHALPISHLDRTLAHLSALEASAVVKPAARRTAGQIVTKLQLRQRLFQELSR